ncbi:hypothetical protein ACIG5E_37185 [Kitasatospora sp. NPDC053057]|uniref:hypothetical protein n=1 Tax=Kitasatospora sp. NPDC053057 TaxID=3364062 RepID=UPI0037C628A9
MIRIPPAEDMHMVRRALVALLDLDDDLGVVAETDRGDQAVPKALETGPDRRFADETAVNGLVLQFIHVL